MTSLTDAEVAAMPRIADATLAKTFHWGSTAEAQLYRECPTAFWLAPDGDEALPPTHGPSLATNDTPALTLMTADGILPAIGFAMGVAGPVFIAGLSMVNDGFETPLVRIATGLLLAVASSPLSIPFGAIAGALPVLMGVILLAHLGAARPIARRRDLWAATGAGMGLLIAALFDAGLVTIPLVVTSAICATVAHMAVDWVEVEPA